MTTRASCNKLPGSTPRPSRVLGAMRHLPLVTCLLLAACTTEPSEPDFTALISRSWTVPAGSYDTYKCTRIRVPEDLYVTAFRGLAPTGTHHTGLTISDDQTLPLGDYDCGVTTLDMRGIYGGGIGTPDFELPDGVAMKIAAGQLLNLNLHVFNATDGELSGESGVLVRTASADAIEHEADLTLAGTVALSIPPDSAPHTFRGGCTAARDYQIVAVWPHMHQYARSQKVEVTRAGVTTAIVDRPYDFTEQGYWHLAEPFAVRAGDRVDVACTYLNDTNVEIPWGDSSTAEMCFAGLARYPAGGDIFECVDR
jgi:hypothetical protein